MKFKDVKNTAKAKWLLATAMVNSAIISSPVLADDPFGKVQSATTNFTEKVRNLSFFVFIATVVVAGLMFAFGDIGKNKAMKWLPYIVGGVALVSGATSLIMWLKEIFG